MTNTAAEPLLGICHQTSNSSPHLVPSEANHRQRKLDFIRYTSLLSAIFSCLCAGSVATFSLYGHLFLTRLNYTQTQVNTVALAAQISLCLSVSLVGYLCDHIQPAFISISAGILFGAGYTSAAFTYKYGANSGYENTEPRALSVWLMVIAFAIIGLATTLMYLSAVTTCVKNFRDEKHRGLALASPIAAIGLSAFWQSQIGNKLFVERSLDGRRGEFDVFKYFLFLAFIQMAAGFVGFFLLKLVNKHDLPREEIEQLERNRLPGSSENSTVNETIYGATVSPLKDGVKAQQRILSEVEENQRAHFLNLKTAIFIRDPTMWFFAIGFLLVAGTGDAFITNLGTIIGTLVPQITDPNTLSTTIATQVSIVSLTSTAARLMFGSLTDIFAPPPTLNSEYHSPNSIISQQLRPSGFFISRVVFLISSALLLSAGHVFLAAGLAQNNLSYFWIISMLIGFGYGAVYTLGPLIVSIVWDVENFGTNWGVIATTPALGIAFWDLIYSSVYDAGARGTSGNRFVGNDKLLCYGKSCYSTTFWAMATSIWIACALWLCAWKGKQGWAKRRITV